MKTTSARAWRLFSQLAAIALGCVLTAGATRAEAACSISNVVGVAFGTYDVFANSPLDSQGQFSWRCTRNTHPPVRITLTRGGSPTFQPRRLAGGAGQLGYNLYLDSAWTAVWGDETEGTQAYYSTYPGSGRVTVYLFGRVPAGQDVAVGTYADTITVVVNF